jgi:alkyl sulfatase BDS1-like metallo-beta-lactamase superfamily hydrolase
MTITETEAATDITRDVLKKTSEDRRFNWQDQRDFDFAQRGLIARALLNDIQNDQGDVVWGITAYDAFLEKERSDTIHPSLWRLAKLNNERGLYRVTEGVYQVRGHALANITFIRGNTGYIVIDPNNTVEIARFALNLLFQHLGKAPVTTIIISHSHSDHWGGIRGIVDADDSNVCVIVPANFVEYVHSETFVSNEGLNTRCNYKGGELLPKTAWGQVDAGLGRMTEAGVVSYLTPTDIIPESGAEITLDGVPAVFQNAPGEAPAGMHIYLPEQKTLFIADNAYAALQNIYTIRGALSRDPLLWYESIRKAMLFDKAEILIGGHHWPRFGREEIRDYLQKQGDVLKYQHDQTVRLMSHGYTPVEIANGHHVAPQFGKRVVLAWILRSR